MFVLVILPYRFISVYLKPTLTLLSSMVFYYCGGRCWARIVLQFRLPLPIIGPVAFGNSCNWTGF